MVHWVSKQVLAIDCKKNPDVFNCQDCKLPHLYGPFLLKLPYYNQKMNMGPWHILSVQIIYIFLHDNGQVYLTTLLQS